MARLLWITFGRRTYAAGSMMSPDRAHRRCDRHHRRREFHHACRGVSLTVGLPGGRALGIGRHESAAAHRTRRLARRRPESRFEMKKIGFRQHVGAPGLSGPRCVLVLRASRTGREYDDSLDNPLTVGPKIVTIAHGERLPAR